MYLSIFSVHIVYMDLPDAIPSVLYYAVPGWCRPQNDGPGLRAYSLMLYAQALIAAGRADYVTQYLWTGSGDKNGGAIKVRTA